jgi:anti-sigma regulatory factor (Ser/Thr protein kinase)
MGSPRAERRFEATRDNVGAARRFVVESLDNVTTDLSVVELLTAELAANAVLHAKSDFGVRVFVDAASARVEIVNDEPELLLSMREPSDEGGRGLHLVEALAHDWGTESHPSEKVVWFAVTVSPSDDSSVDA